MSPLEKKILEVLPLHSEDAKFKARLILGWNSSSSGNISKDVYDEKVRLSLYKFLKI
jgi:hypothetical protein